MDIDKIKNTWNSVQTPSSEEDTIKNIIHKRTKTTLEQLVLTETVFLVLSLTLISVPFLLSGYLAFPVITKWVYISFCIVGAIWQIYKVTLLKKIDLAQKGIVYCTKNILKYKLHIKYEIIIGYLFIVLISVIFIYECKDVLSDTGFMILCLINVSLWLCIGIYLYYFYKRFYYKKIKQIELSLREIKMLEKI